jgi:hypothetical protein
LDQSLPGHNPSPFCWTVDDKVPGDAGAAVRV